MFMFPVQYADLTEKEINKYLRQIVLTDIGFDGQVKLRNATATVVGLGGLGSLIAMQLTAMGIGTLKIVDMDLVDESNLHRQYLYDTSLIGIPKVEAAAMKLQKLNPDVNIVTHPTLINENNVKEIIKESDVVIDGLDRITPRYVLNRASYELNIPYVFGAAIESFGSVSTFIPKKTPCLECIYKSLTDDDLPKCSIVGVHPSVLGITASIEVSEAIRLIIGEEPHLMGKLLYIDLRSFSFDTIRINKNPTCPVCSLEKATLATLHTPDIFEECARNGLPVFVIDPKKIMRLGFDVLTQRLMKIGFSLKNKTALSVVFTINNTTVTVLQSGVTIIIGKISKEKALEIYETLNLEEIGDER